jgi:hypothetical protein
MPNAIYGYVAKDSMPNQPVDTFKVWLITYNAQSNMLTAIDSTITAGVTYAGFTFSNKPAGIYRTKAHKLNQVPTTAGYVPTYRDSALTWNTAVTFTHNNGITSSGVIYLRQGLVTSGPGFIGGNVLMGANKGTADGDPVIGQLVFLKDASGKLVQSAYTNSTGAYSFTNIPLGTYTVYPEEMNYATTPSSSITITASNASVTGIGFKKDDVDMDIKPVTTGIGSVEAKTIAFTMQPNPTTGTLTLNLGTNATGTADIHITSITGQTVYRGSIKAAASTTLSLGHLESGMYFVAVSTAEGSHTEKLIIAK